MPPRRQVWTDNEKQTLLEGLIVMQSQGFDPNDTNAWFEPSNSAAIITFLRNGHVREHWLDNVDKARRKNMNTKAAYNSFRLLDQRHTGGGVRTPFPLEDLVEQLANADNPIARPPIVIDNGTIIRDATHPANVESANVNLEPTDAADVAPFNAVPPSPASFNNPVPVNRATRRNRPPTGAATARTNAFNAFTEHLREAKELTAASRNDKKASRNDKKTSPLTSEIELVLQKRKFDIEESKLDLEYLQFLDRVDPDHMDQLQQRLLRFKKARLEIDLEDNITVETVSSEIVGVDTVEVDTVETVSSEIVGVDTIEDIPDHDNLDGFLD